MITGFKEPTENEHGRIPKQHFGVVGLRMRLSDSPEVSHAGAGEPDMVGSKATATVLCRHSAETKRNVHRTKSQEESASLIAPSGHTATYESVNRREGTKSSGQSICQDVASFSLKTNYRKSFVRFCHDEAAFVHPSGMRSDAHVVHVS